jgi:hypothetical protein
METQGGNTTQTYMYRAVVSEELGYENGDKSGRRGVLRKEGSFWWEESNGLDTVAVADLIKLSTPRRNGGATAVPKYRTRTTIA